MKHINSSLKLTEKKVFATFRIVFMEPLKRHAGGKIIKPRKCLYSTGNFVFANLVRSYASAPKRFLMRTLNI